MNIRYPIYEGVYRILTLQWRLGGPDQDGFPRASLGISR